MDNCLISCQVMADMKKVYDDLIICNKHFEFLEENKSAVQWILDS